MRVPSIIFGLLIIDAVFILKIKIILYNVMDTTDELFRVQTLLFLAASVFLVFFYLEILYIYILCDRYEMNI